MSFLSLACWLGIVFAAGLVGFSLGHEWGFHKGVKEGYARVCRLGFSKVPGAKP